MSQRPMSSQASALWIRQFDDAARQQKVNSRRRPIAAVVAMLLNLGRQKETDQ